MIEMDCRDADVYSEVANVLEVLHDTVDMYMSFMQDSEENERESRRASASASTTSLPTSALTELDITRQKIKENVPYLLSLCVSVRNVLRRVVLLAHQSSRGSGSEPLSAPDSEGSATSAAVRNEAVCELITRKLGDIVENADMIRGLVKLQQQQQQQHQLTPRASHTELPNVADDTDEGPLLMKQLIRVTLYSLEDTEQLLRAAYPGAASTDNVAGDKDSEDDRSSPWSHSSAVRRTLSSPYGQCLGYSAGGNDIEASRDSRNGGDGLHDPAACGQSNSSGDAGANSSSVTPRSSTHTAPYVRRSSSLGPVNSATGSWTALIQSGHNSDSDATPSLHLTGTAPVSPTADGLPTSIPARPWQADSSSASSLAPSVPKSSSPRVRFAIDERPGSGDHDSSLSERALAATVTPQQSSRCNSGLLSNPVVRRISSGSDENSRSGDGGDTMQPAPLGRQRPSLMNAQHSSSPTPTASVTISESESIDTAFATPSTAEALQQTVPLDTGSETEPVDAVTASRLRLVNMDGAFSPPVWPSGDFSPPQSGNESSSESGRGGLGRTLPLPVGLPPRSPRRQDPQRLSTSLASSSDEQRISLGPDPAGVKPNVRVTTQHVQRLPGELWGVIIVRHRAEMEDVLREDVLDLFNNGAASPVLRNEDVREVSFTVVGKYLYSRIQLDHLCSLAESEINTRLDVCSYPLMRVLYEEFFKERQVRELGIIEDNVEMLGNGMLRYSDVYSIGGGGVESGGNEEGKQPSNENVEQCPLSLAGHLNASEAAADGSTAVARTSPLSVETDPLTNLRDSAAASDVSSMPSLRATVGRSSGGVGGVGGEVSSTAAPSDFVSVEDSTLLRERAATASALRHPHTVRIPGTHWVRLLVSPVPENSDLHSAFIQDTGVALGVLPSEARAACQEVCFSCGSLAVSFVWDNAELYPGAVPLSAPEIDTTLQGCPYSSVRALYANACVALSLDDDLAEVSSPNRSRSSGGGGTAGSGTLRGIPPYNPKLGSATVAQGAPVSDWRSSVKKLETSSVTKWTEENIPSTASSPSSATVRCEAAAAGTASREASPSPQQHQRGVHTPRFSRIESTTSHAPAGVVPLVAASLTATNHLINSPKGQQRRWVRSPAGTPRGSVAAVNPSSPSATGRRAIPESSQAPVTLNRLALFYGVSVSALRQWNPALAELDADTVIPGAAAVHVPRHSPSPARVGEQAGSPVASGAGHHRDSTDSAFSATTSATAGRRTARLSPSPALVVPKPPSPQHQEGGSPSLKAPASKLEVTKSSTGITVSAEKGNVPVVATRRRQSLLSMESIEKHCTSLTLATVRSADISAATPVAAAATPASASPVATTRSHSSNLETPAPAGAKVPPAAVEQPETPAKSDAVPTKQTAPFLPTEPSPTASSTREVSPRAPWRVTSTSTASSAGSRAPPAHIVYRLPGPQTSRAAEPRGVEAILAVQRIPHLPLDAVGLKAAIAANGGAHSWAVGEDQADHACHGKGVDGPMPLLERDLGLRLHALTVAQVRPGSVAARAKIQAGDTLRTVGGKALISQSDLQRIMAQQQQQWRHRKEDREHTLFVTAITSRGTPATYRLRLPPPPCDGAATSPDVSHALSARPALPLTSRRTCLPLSARTISARRTLPHQQQGIQRPLQASPRAPVRLAAAMSARTRVSSLGASPGGTRALPSTTSAALQHRSKLPDTVHSISTAVSSA